MFVTRTECCLTFLYQQSWPRRVTEWSTMSSATTQNACNWNKIRSRHMRTCKMQYVTLRPRSLTFEVMALVCDMGSSCSICVYQVWTSLGRYDTLSVTALIGLVILTFHLWCSWHGLLVWWATIIIILGFLGLSVLKPGSRGVRHTDRQTNSHQALLLPRHVGLGL